MASHGFDNHLVHIASLESKFGPQSEEVAVALKTLARLICRYDEPAEAVPYFERCIGIREALRGPASILPDLDEWVDQKIDFSFIEPFMLKRLSIKAETFGGFEPRVGDECDALASEYVYFNRFAAARVLRERSLTIREKVYGPRSAEVAAGLESLVCLCLSEKRREEADRYLERCKEVHEYVFGTGSKEVASLLASLAVAYIKSSNSQTRRIRSGYVAKARSMFEDALSIKERLFGSDSPDVQKALEAMIWACLECGPFREAEPLLKRLLSTCERVYGDSSAALLWILVELAQGYAQERSDQAEAMIERSFEILRKFLDVKRSIFQDEIGDSPANMQVLVSRSRTGLLENLVRASERFRSNTRRRWGASS